MVSLNKLMNVNEKGVTFISPHTAEKSLLSPEMSVAIQVSFEHNYTEYLLALYGCLQKLLCNRTHFVVV